MLLSDVVQNLSQGLARDSLWNYSSGGRESVEFVRETSYCRVV